MKNSETSLSNRYAKALRNYMNGGGENELAEAYELGRRAIDDGMGVLDIAGVHEAALESFLPSAQSPEGCAQIAKAVEDFFAESLAPFEMAQRGYRQANAELRELNRTLESRVEERTRQLREKDRAIRKAYVDVFSAVTGGKMIILTDEELAAALAEPVCEFHVTTDFRSMSKTRRDLEEILERSFPDLRNREGLVMAANEAVTNAVKHGGNSRWRVFKAFYGVQVLIEDSGPGIDFSILPKATLMAGFSTKRTLGVGFTMMLEFCDRVLLSTDKNGTSIVLEMGENPVRD